MLINNFFDISTKFTQFHVKSCRQNCQETGQFSHFVPEFLCTSHLDVSSSRTQRLQPVTPAQLRVEVDKLQ